jgi:NAD(P)-dependent dehydrogenase (short-subunit alcohol dehydrogenase family)
VVTGVLGHLGPIWTDALLGAGATVVGIDRATSVPEALAYATRGDRAGRFRLLRADVTVTESLHQALADCLGQAGIPSVLVNNAGVDQPPVAGASSGRFGEIPDAVSARILDVNALGTLRMCQIFGTEMARHGTGSIINIGSLYGVVAPDPRFYEHLEQDPPFLKPPAYGMSKAAVAALTRYLATLWGPAGVRVNTLSPGGVLGDQDPVFRRGFADRVPLGRMAVAADLAGPLLFLASDLSRYVTGTELLVDGGFTCW